MKLVLDMNLPVRWVQALGTAGFDTVHWSTTGAATASDAEIMAWAVAHGAHVVTHDLDFGAILAATKAARPSVVQIRSDDVIAQATVARLTAALRELSAEMEDGALMTIDTSKTRIRLLPTDR